MSQESNQHRLDTLRHQWRSEPTPRRTLQLAEEYGRTGNLEAALEVLRVGLEKHPGHVASRVALGRYLLEVGRPGEARGFLEQVALEDQTHLVANKLLVESHLELGEAHEARNRLDLYTLLNESDADIELLEARLEVLEAAGDRVSEAVDGTAGASEAVSSATDQGGEADLDIGFLAGLSESPVERIGFRGGSGDFTNAPELPDPAVPEAAEEPVSRSAAEQTEATGLDPGSPQEGEGEGDLFQNAWAGIERKGYWDSLGSDAIFALEPRPSEKETPPEPHGPAEVIEAPSPVVSEPEAVSETDGEVFESTVTLGRLYLEQGHTEEAGRVFKEVLEREPGNRSALAGLAATESGSAWALTAADLVPIDVLDRGSVVERRRELLTAYLARLKPTAARV